MKLERSMKRHYRDRIGAVDLPEFESIAARLPRDDEPLRAWRFNTLFNCAVHAVIAVIVVFGLLGFREESPLSARITRIAVEVSLDKRIEHRVKLLSDNLIIIRNTR